MARQTTFSLLDEVSKEDCTLLAKSFKDEKFRQLLCEYAKEVNDPVNRKQFEKEIIEYEKECGVEAVFVHPTPGFVFALKGNGDRGFVNVCSSDVVQKPDMQLGSGVSGIKGPKLSLPHVVPKPRLEVVTGDHREGGSRKDETKVNNVAVVSQTVMYDVVFHPEALQLACQFPTIKQTLIDTSVDTLRKHYNVKIDRVEMVDKAYMGTPAQSVIKRKVGKENVQGDHTKSNDKNDRTKAISNKGENVSDFKINGETNFIEPKYKLKHVRKMDFQDFAVHLIPQSSVAYHPQTLELEVILPGVVKASQVSADIQHQSLLLTTESIPKYKLELPIRYPIDEDKSTAKFDVSAQKLTLTLPVVPLDNKKRSEGHGSDQSQSPPSDSGIECEFDTRTNVDNDNVSEGLVTPHDDDDDDDDDNKDGRCVTTATTTISEEDNVFEPPSVQPDILTLAPNYYLQQTKESMYISLCCENVLPSSIKVTQSDNMNGRIELSTIGGGQTLVQYSLRIAVSPYKIAASGLTYKEEEGKVVLIVKKAMNELWEALKVGHGDSLTTINLPGINPASVKDKQTKLLPEENEDGPKKTTCVSRPPRMSRTVSMCETEGGHPFRLRGPTCSWPRGILKHRVRSLSESQVGTFSSSSPLGPIDSALDIDVFESKSKSGDDEEEESLEESVASSYGEKKSVRFNEVVSRQLFRSNSSILGQRAKNQRKATRKRKSQARRGSVSDKDVGTSGDSDITTDAATDDDTDGASSNTTELDDNVNVESDSAGNTKINIERKENKSSIDNITTLTTDAKNNVMSKLNKNITNTNNKSKSNNNNNNNNNNSDESSNKGDNNGGFICENVNKDEKEQEDNSDFIIKTSKKKKRKNRKHKVPNFQPTNVLIFQLDMDK